ncbi:hypothetical protein FIBSPDRAFT_1040419 [Athelia psychrophila]|uniref:Uncharacterized protein n=1 Tax=Athelia psychrophila TaxID=1759441 RepID=A0A166Q9Y7_9AGAM|nr:hypothetical protein FIBSPDRAFT_1040419 [Fibularhizoctonia sp. CBS 109695]
MPHLNPNYATPGESLWAERSIFIGKALACVPYGMLVLLYLQCADALLHKKHVAHARKYALFAYSSFILVLATLAIGLAIRWGEMVFVDDRNYPGGPAIFYNAFDSYWVPIASNSCFVVLNLAANAMLIYRYFVIWQRNWWCLVAPGLTFLTAIPISVLFMVSTARNDTAMMPMGLAYWALTISFNIILTVLVSGRLWIAKRYDYSHLEAKHHDVYGRITDIMIESAAPYSIFGILQLVAYTRDYDGLRRLFQGALGQVQAVTTLLIVLRMGRGRAYASEDSSSLSVHPRFPSQRQLPIVDLVQLPIVDLV